MGDPYRQAPKLEDDGFPVKIEVTLNKQEFEESMLDYARRNFPDVDWKGAQIDIECETCELTRGASLTVKSVSIVKDTKKENTK